MIDVKETSFINTDLVMVQMGVPKDEWEKIQSSEEWKKILNGDVSARIVEKPATEETLQSIDSTLKRIEKLLSNKTDIDIIVDGIVDSVTKAFSSSRLVKNEEDKKASPRHRW